MSASPPDRCCSPPCCFWHHPRAWQYSHSGPLPSAYSWRYGGSPKRLLEAARVIDWRTYLIVLLGGEGGLRVGEIVALEWADIDQERRQISIRHLDWRGQLTTPKNGRGRFVAMTERVAMALRKPRHLRSSRVLCKDNGESITRQGAWSRVRYAARRANVPTGVHILRHTFCSHLVMRAAAMRSVQELVGHQDLTMTQRYSHLSPAMSS